MASDAPILTVGPPPHWRGRSSITQMNYAFIVALVPAALVGALSYGIVGDAATAELGPAITTKTKFLEVLLREFGLNAWFLSVSGALGILALGAGLGMLVEYATQVIFRQPYEATNGHGLLMGLLLAMMMPPTVPWWVLVMGVIVTIVVGKQIFGGIGGYPFHPAMVGLLILVLSWDKHLYPIDSIASMHWVVTMLIIAGGLTLAVLGHIRWQIPAGVIIGVLVMGAVFHGLNPTLAEGPLWQKMLMELVTGHVMLAAFFIATDTTASPSKAVPMWIFGLLLGVLIMLIRVKGAWPDAVPFAVLLANVLSPLLDKIPWPPVKEVVIQNG